MNRILSIMFFILVWFACSAQTFNVFAVNDGYCEGQITFKPEFRDGYIFYHLENLGKEPFENCNFIADESFQNFINAYNAIKKGEDFNIALLNNNLQWNEDYTQWFFPTLIRAACKDCELPKELNQR